MTSVLDILDLLERGKAGWLTHENLKGPLIWFPRQGSTNIYLKRPVAVAPPAGSGNPTA